MLKDELVREVTLWHLAVVLTETRCNNRFHRFWF